MCAHCANKRNGGKLKNNVPQPQFLADPSHRVKVMSKPLFAMTTKTKDPTKLKMIDAMRMEKYIGYYITQNMSNAIAPVEHLFDEHSFCDSSWCYSKEIEESVHKIITESVETRVSFIICENNKRNFAAITYLYGLLM